MGSNYETNGGRKSRDTLPLKGQCHEIVYPYFCTKPSTRHRSLIIRLERLGEIFCFREDIRLQISNFVLASSTTAPTPSPCSP